KIASIFNDLGNPTFYEAIEFEWMHKRMDGSLFPAEVLLSALEVDGNKILQATVRDISNRKKAEEALRSLSTTFSAVSGEEFFSNVAAHMTTTLGMDYAIIGELTGDQDRVNVVGGYAHGQPKKLPFQYDLAGTPCEHVVGQSFCIAPSGVQQQYPDDTLLAELGVEGYMGSPLFDSSGQPLGIIVLMHGKTIENTEVAESLFRIFSARVSAEIERRQAEESVRKLSSAIEQAGESVIITDRDGVIKYANPAFTRITGYSAEDAIGQTPKLLKSDNHDDAFYEAMWKTITDGKVWHGKVIDRRKDGTFYPAMLTISPIINKAEEVTDFVGTQSDLSQLEDMEHRFHQAQKMEAIGVMVGGIAHNFNNMLAGMTGNIYLAKLMLEDEPDVVRKLAKVEELSHHAADMIQQLLTFARKGMVIMKEMPLTPFVKETLKLLHTLVPENITLNQEICSEPLSIKGDGAQLHQVLVNLLNNARDAVENTVAPCITIRLELFHTDAALIENHPYFESGAYAHLSIEDNGVGIPEQQQEHLFEPFFTTKEQGKGTGLGLSMVYGALKTHGGFVDVNSTEGEGTTFHCYLPLLEKEASPPESTPATEATAGQGELILLADDEQIVRDIMAEILESLGYRVLQAKDGLETVELFKEHQGEIALAILDVVMPHCGGMALAKQIRAVNPDMPIMFVTGYDKEHLLNGEEPLPNSDVLTKPVNFDLLSRVSSESHNILKDID
ncbi:MAG: PAS domain S-box protein, partial [Mariprofundus sp.]